jgi:hypothetical protein
LSFRPAHSCLLRAETMPEKTVDPNSMTIALDVDVTLLKTVRVIGSRSAAARHIADSLKDELTYMKGRFQALGYSVAIRINTNRVKV